MNIDNICYSKPLNIKSSKYRYNKLIKYKHYSLKLCSINAHELYLEVND